MAPVKRLGAAEREGGCNRKAGSREVRMKGLGSGSAWLVRGPDQQTLPVFPPSCCIFITAPRHQASWSGDGFAAGCDVLLGEDARAQGDLLFGLFALQVTERDGDRFGAAGRV